MGKIVAASTSDLLMPAFCVTMNNVIKKEPWDIKVGKKRSAILRKDGRWQVYAKVRGQRKACYGHTEYEANYEADLKEALAFGDEKALDILLYNRFLFCNTFIRYRNYLLFFTSVSNSTVDRYEATYFKYFYNSSIDGRCIQDIEENDLANFVTNIMQKCKEMTSKEYQRIQHIMKAVIDFAYDEELKVDAVPIYNWQKIKKRAETRGRIYKRVKKEYAVSEPNKQILRKKILDENVYPEKFAHVILLLINFSIGMRIGELAALKENDVDMERHVVSIKNSCKSYKRRDDYGNPIGSYVYTVGETKTEAGEREVPMSHMVQFLFEVLFQYRKEMNYRSPYLAYDGEDVKSRVRDMETTLQRLCERSGIEHFNSHIIRKSFATALSRCPDIDIATISEYMGHAQVSTTVNNYLIPAKDSLEDRINKLSSVV